MVTKVVSIKCAEPAQAIGTTGLRSWPWLLVGDVPEPVPDSFEVLLASIVEAVGERSNAVKPVTMPVTEVC